MSKIFIAFDFGITNTDIGVMEDKRVNFYTIASNKNYAYIDSILKFIKEINVSSSNIALIGVTGGKSSDLQSSVNGISIIKINEIDAIGLGTKTLYDIKDESALVVSAGTGTACVHIQGNKFNHLGGIAVGGGMLEGLGSLIFKNSSGLEINEFAVKGSRAELDLLIGDVVNKIGDLSPEITAVNFGRAKDSLADTMENTAAALCNMIGEVIGTIACLNAILVGSQKIYFIGRTSNLSEVINGVNERLNLAGIKGEYRKNREYGNVIGVLEKIKSL
jgi:type II pantothenate kinase